MILLRQFVYFLFGFVLLAFVPAYGEMSISANASLDSFYYDLDNIHLKLEKLDANWQFSPFGEGRLAVEKMRAKRLIITIGEGSAKSKDTGLPNRIKLPFPIKIQQAEVAEVLLIKDGETQTFSNLKFDLETDSKTIKLNTVRIDTPWGETISTVQMSTAKPFALHGVSSLKKTNTSTASQLKYDVKVELSGDLETLHYSSSMLLAKRNAQTEIVQTLQAEAMPIARIQVNGQIGLAADYLLSAKVAVNEVQPNLFGNYPAAKLNFDANLQGKLLPKPEVTLQFSARDSQWQGQPLVSNGKLRIEDNQLRNINVQASIANNSIQANGSLGQVDSKLDWQVDLADLRQLAAESSGKVLANGTLTGTLDSLRLQLQLAAEQLTLPGSLSVEKLAGQAALNAGETGKLDGAFQATNVQYGQHTLSTGSLTLTGTQAKHQLIIAAQGKAFKLDSTLQGGLNTASTQWQGLLQSLNVSGSTAIKLSAPAAINFASSGVSLEKAHLQLAKGQLMIDLLNVGADGFTSSGSANQITLDDLPQTLYSLPANLQGSPVFSGRWNLNATNRLNGNFNIWRESGDFTMTTAVGITKPLGLHEIKFTADFINNAVTVNTKLTGENIGNIEGTLSTALTKVDSGFALTASAPLTLNGTAQLRSLAWLPLPASLMDASLDGSINLTVAANGTVGAPNLIGEVRGENLQFILPTEGVDFKNGALEAAFTNNQLRIKKASWQGGDGNLNITGSLLFDNGKPTIALDWTANKFTAITRADRLLTLNGTGATSLLNDMLTISGNFVVEKGLVELADEDTPALGDDVIVLGQAEVAPESALKILLNGLRIDLGKEFILRGRGLDAELTGAITLMGLTQYRPHTEGVIQVKKGTYMAYGQVLNIERGILNFNGTVDNPGINIRAMRNSKPVNAGIEITGTAFIPITKLVSDPSVTDSEKLSWLVLGHGMDQTTKNDYGLLSLAAGVLLSQGQSVPLQTQLARAAGLDEFSFAGGDATSASLVFGKRLTSRLYLSYQKSISGLLDVARLTFNITSRWSLRAEAGTESAVDVLYTFSFK